MCLTNKPLNPPAAVHLLYCTVLRTLHPRWPSLACPSEYVREGLCTCVCVCVCVLADHHAPWSCTFWLHLRSVGGEVCKGAFTRIRTLFI